jgi:predicted transcriptional regulator
MPNKENDMIKSMQRRAILLFCVGLCMASFGSGKTFGRGYGRRSVNSKDDILEQQTRNSIYQLIRDNEGLHFRKICRLLDKKMGVVQYHVSVLEKHGLIRSIRDGRYKCFFATDPEKTQNISPDQRNSEEESLRETIITSLRRKTPQILISYLAREKVASHQTLSTAASVSPQAITFHMTRLSQFGIIKSQKEGRQKFYSLTDIAKSITDKLESYI